MARRAVPILILLVAAGPWHSAWAQDATTSLTPVPDAPVVYETALLPFLKKHCYACHGGAKVEAELSFPKYNSNADVFGDRLRWESVIEMLHHGDMPPIDKPRPDTAEVQGVIRDIRRILREFDCSGVPSVGRVTLRRLNRTEYNNTIRDLVGVKFSPAADFPADDVGYGFDNIGDVLSVSPLLLEKYLSAAESILEEALAVETAPVPALHKYQQFRKEASATRQEIGKLLTFDAGDYRFRWRVKRLNAPSQELTLLVLENGRERASASIRIAENGEAWIEQSLTMRPETVRMTLGARPDSRDAFEVLELEVSGPHNPPVSPKSETFQRIMGPAAGEQNRAAAQRVLSAFASRAFRRPATNDEVERCLVLFDQRVKLGESFDAAVRAALYRVLVSPQFLFRVELDPPAAKPGETYVISEYELASRLSYFLWNSMPDEELLRLAAAGELRAQLRPQAQRLLSDPRSSSFLQGFCEQWLLLRKLDLAAPDPRMFPDFDDELRDAMSQETRLTFEKLVRADGSLLDLLTSQHTYVNERLAKHYGIAGIQGEEFVKAALPPGRAGILTQGSILTLTSNATRTSPVKRGKFVLDQVLNTPPPPPPPNIPELEAQKDLRGTLRQVMEQHRANAVCASCHQRMDPIGFSFENFNAVGQWRDLDGGVAVDASGTMPDGKEFRGASGLSEVLLEKKELFATCLVEKMMTYALGRGLEGPDRCQIDAVRVKVEQGNYQFSALIGAIIESDAFQKRTAAGTNP